MVLVAVFVATPSFAKSTDYVYQINIWGLHAELTATVQSSVRRYAAAFRISQDSEILLGLRSLFGKLAPEAKIIDLLAATSGTRRGNRLVPQRYCHLAHLGGRRESLSLYARGDSRLVVGKKKRVGGKRHSPRPRLGNRQALDPIGGWLAALHVIAPKSVCRNGEQEVFAGRRHIRYVTRKLGRADIPSRQGLAARYVGMSGSVCQLGIEASAKSSAQTFRLWFADGDRDPPHLPVLVETLPDSVIHVSLALARIQPGSKMRVAETFVECQAGQVPQLPTGKNK